MVSRLERCDARGLGVLGTPLVWVVAPWDPVDPLLVQFLERETAHVELISTQRLQTGVWVYINSSVQLGACGVVAIFEDFHGPFGCAHLSITSSLFSQAKMLS